MAFLHLLLLFLFSSVYSSFAIFPLRLLKKNNLDIPFNSHTEPFIGSNFSDYQFITNFYLQCIYTELTIGTPQHTFQADLNSYTNIIRIGVDNKYQTSSNINLFNYSKTLELTNLTVTPRQGSVNINGIARDHLHIQTLDNLNKRNNTITKKMNTDFYVTTFYDDRNIKLNDSLTIQEINKTFTFTIGMRIDKSEAFKTSNFMQSLKESGVSPTFDFSFEFYKTYDINLKTPDDYIGNMIFGNFDEIYNTNKNPKERLKKAKLVPDSNTISYIIYFNEVYIETKDKKRVPISAHQKGEFIFSQPVFHGCSYYLEVIQENFFNILPKGICELKKYNTAYMTVQYNFFVCDNKVKEHSEEFPPLKFYNEDLEQHFEFTFADLFKEYFGKTYFLIVFDMSRDKKDKWEIGKVFLQKYQLFFNTDSKTVMYYHTEETNTTKEENGNTAAKVLKILLELLIVAVIIFVSFYFGTRFTRRRKLRANELEDNYEFIENIKDKPTQV